MSDERILYFAYGSNMHPHRMKNRVPSVQKVNIARLLNYSLCFHKKGWNDGSGKCNAFLTGNCVDEVIGVVYRMLKSEKAELDLHEGVGKGYEVREVKVVSESSRYPVFTYTAHEAHIDESLVPFSWYKHYVIHGAVHHQLPDTYVERIKSVIAVEDPDEERAAEEFTVLRSLSG